MYEDSIVNLKTRKPVERRARRNTAEKEQAAKDYYASVRTNVSRTVYVLASRLTESNDLDPACLDSEEREPGVTVQGTNCGLNRRLFDMIPFCTFLISYVAQM